MESVIPKYVRPIAEIDDPKNLMEYWEEALEAFDKKEYKKTIIAVINYINPNLLQNKNLEDDIEIVQMQGSAEIIVEITNIKFSVKAPFLRITEKTNKVALLRKVAEINFNPLRLEQIHLRNNELWFEYEMPIELTHPNKLYDLLRNVAVFADDYDDLFISNYKAEFYKPPAYTQLSESEKEQAWKQISDIFEDYENFSLSFKKKRLDDFVWDLVVISLLKISNMPYVHGKLRTDLYKHLSILFDTGLDISYKIDKGVNYIKRLMQTQKEDLLKNLYHTTYFISLKKRSSPQIISDRLRDDKETVLDYIRDENYFNLVFYLQFTFLKLMYDYNLEEHYKQAIYQALEEVSYMDYEKGSIVLLNLYYEMLNDSLITEDEENNE